MGWVNPGWTPGAHQSRSITALLSWTEERKIQQKACRLRQGQGDHAAITITAKTDLTWGEII